MGGTGGEQGRGRAPGSPRAAGFSWQKAQSPPCAGGHFFHNRYVLHARVKENGQRSGRAGPPDGGGGRKGGALAGSAFGGPARTTVRRAPADSATTRGAVSAPSRGGRAGRCGRAAAP